MPFSNGRNNGQIVSDLDDIAVGTPPPILWQVTGAVNGGEIFEYNDFIFTFKGQGGDISVGNPIRELIQLDLADGTENWAVNLPLVGGTYSGDIPIGISATGTYIATTIAGLSSTLYFLDPSDGSTMATSAVPIQPPLGGHNRPLITASGDVVAVASREHSSPSYVVRIAGYARDSYAIGDLIWEETGYITLPDTDEQEYHAYANEFSTFTEMTDGTIVYTTPWLSHRLPNSNQPKTGGLEIVARNGETGARIADRAIEIGDDEVGHYYCPSYLTSMINPGSGKEILTCLASNSPGYSNPPFNWVVEWELSTGSGGAFEGDGAFTLNTVCGGLGVPAWGSEAALTLSAEFPLLRPAVKTIPPVEHGACNVDMNVSVLQNQLVFVREGRITRNLGAVWGEGSPSQGFSMVTDSAGRSIFLIKDNTHNAGNTFGMIEDGHWIWKTTVLKSGFSNPEITSDNKVLLNCNGLVTCYDPDGTDEHRPPGDLISP